MAQIKQLLQEKGFKSSEKLREECSLSNWEIAQTLFDNLIHKCTKQSCLIELKTTDKIITNKMGIPVKTIRKTKLKKIRLNHVGFQHNGLFLSSPALWVKPIIQNNRIVFFWKGQYIDGATIFGENINKYQD